MTGSNPANSYDSYPTKIIIKTTVPPSPGIRKNLVYVSHSQFMNMNSAFFEALQIDDLMLNFFTFNLIKLNL